MFCFWYSALCTALCNDLVFPDRVSNALGSATDTGGRAVRRPSAAQAWVPSSLASDRECGKVSQVIQSKPS
jgi:hypothetical protein